MVKGKFGQASKSLKNYDLDSLQNFFFLYFLAAPFAENSHILARIYFIFFKQGPRPNLKDFQCQI